MRNIENININESLNKQKLVFKEDWFDKFDRFSLYFIFSLVIGVFSFVIFNLKIENTLVTDIIFPLVILFCIYVIYRKASELSLTKVESLMDSKMNLKLLIDYAEQKQYDIYSKSYDLLILNESSDFNSNQKKTMIFILKDNFVLFTIIQDKSKVNVPILISHIFLKFELKKLFSKIDN